MGDKIVLNFLSARIDCQALLSQGQFYRYVDARNLTRVDFKTFYGRK
jgi:hypothetical protein